MASSAGNTWLLPVLDYFTQVGALYGAASLPQALGQVAPEVRHSLMQDLGIVFQQAEGVIKAKDLSDATDIITRSVGSAKRLQDSLSIWTPTLRWLGVLIASEKRWIRLAEQAATHQTGSSAGVWQDLVKHSRQRVTLLEKARQELRSTHFHRKQKYAVPVPL